MSERLEFETVLKRPDLVSGSVFNAVRDWYEPGEREHFMVAEIDPTFAGGTDFCDRYGIEYTDGANCVVIQGERGPLKSYAACLTPVGKKTDFNRTARKILNARRVGLAPLDFVLQETLMEYGSITAIGLPTTWRILIDSSIATVSQLIIGSGVINSKLRLPGRILLKLPGAQLVEGLALLDRT